MEYIVKYHGDIRFMSVQIEILSSSYAIAELSAGEAEELLSFREIEYLEPAKKLLLSEDRGMDVSCITPVHQENGYHLTGAGVAVGIIDSGIDLSHPEFRNPDGSTRILSLWDMTADGTPPPGFYKGAEFQGSDIDAGAAESRDSVGHGTAVAGVAVGRSGAAPQASIVAVKLGDADSRTTDMMRGIKYVIHRAQQLGMPCVINLSYGSNNGSHRGQSLFETFIDEMSRCWKTVIVCAAGNEGFGGHHFSGRLTSGGTVNAEFTVAYHRNDLYLTLWKNFADITAYELFLPGGQSTGRIIPANRRAEISLGGVNITVEYDEPSHYTTAQEIYITLEEAGGHMEGLWTLSCYGDQVVDGRFDIWLPTIEEVTERTSFLLPCIDMTMTLPASAVTPISVGGYRPDTDAVCPFSGRGGSVFESGVPQLDLTAPAENIYSARSGGGYDVFTGTSMAAPFVTGAAALLMEWGVVRGNDPFLYGQRIKAFLCKNAGRNSYLAYPNPLWGYGKLNLCAALDDLMNYRRS
ncbi:S8 family serine peptidase [Bacilliculturomica massiliensis]|uniref:S8 family serine peptidase n=1 Tax=Bacilliculturomica massiliensis TaxID=1917867 RepID=UPI0013EF0BE6|nr:S8 family serine peptidase [Bacilliculturomica massiliensis]